MESEGIVLNDPEPMPVDPYTKRRENPPPSLTKASASDNMHQFLTMDRKVKDISPILNSPGNSYIFGEIYISSIKDQWWHLF